MAIATVTLNTVVYGLSANQGGFISWLATAVSGILSGLSRLTFRQTGPNAQAKDPVVRQEYKLDLPIVADASSECACVGDVLRTYSATISILLPPKGTTAERTDFGLRLKDLLANTAVQAGIVAGQPPV